MVYKRTLYNLLFLSRLQTFLMWGQYFGSFTPNKKQKRNCLGTTMKWTTYHYRIYCITQRIENWLCGSSVIFIFYVSCYTSLFCFVEWKKGTGNSTVSNIGLQIQGRQKPWCFNIIMCIVWLLSTGTFISLHDEVIPSISNPILLLFTARTSPFCTLTQFQYLCNPQETFVEYSPCGKFPPSKNGNISKCFWGTLGIWWEEPLKIVCTYISAIGKVMALQNSSALKLQSFSFMCWLALHWWNPILRIRWCTARLYIFSSLLQHTL